MEAAEASGGGSGRQWRRGEGAPARRRGGVTVEEEATNPPVREREESGWERVGGGLGGPVETGWLK
jgi:hypothetical protein